jgi:GNAT superfamily N-acetyltransferase
MNEGKNVNNLEVRACKPNELPNLIDRLDREFIFNKQRSLSLSKRFPNTLSVENIAQIRVAVSGGVICGAHTIRIFDWITEKRAWHGAMVGMVWVDSQQRGKRIASDLLSSATQFLKEKDVDFGVLWTGSPAVYERAGWFLNDCGLFGEVTNRPPSPYIDSVSCRPLVSADAARLERLRSSFLPMRIVRNSLDYRTIPIPADKVLCFAAQNNDVSTGYALVGEQDSIGYFYEMVAPPILWDLIWSAVTERFGRLFINGHSSDPFSRWLAQKGFVAWRHQNKTMWLRVSQRMENELVDTWHIPYFDWI